MKNLLVTLALVGGFIPGAALAYVKSARSADGRLEATFHKVENYWMGSRTCRIDVRDVRTGKLVVAIRHGIDSANFRVAEKIGGLICFVAGYGPEYPCSPRLLDGLDGMVFSPDGSQLAITYDGRLRLFEIPSGARSGSLDLTGYTLPVYHDIAFSKDGKRLFVPEPIRHRTYTMDTHTGSVTYRTTR